VCGALGIINPGDVTRRLDDDEKGIDIIYTLGGQQEVTVVNEPGFYQVILLSRKPIAKKLKRWVTHDVLPSIRKHGAYVTPHILDLLKKPEAVRTLLLALSEEQEKVQQLEQQLEFDKPKVAFADALASAEGGVRIVDFARVLANIDIKTGRNRVLQVLENDGFVCKDKATNRYVPAQAYMDRNLFEVKFIPNWGDDGKCRIYPTLLLTGKGVKFFIEYFMHRYGAKKRSLPINSNMLTQDIDDDFTATDLFIERRKANESN
jgi:anti-repressor protein